MGAELQLQRPADARILRTSERASDAAASHQSPVDRICGAKH
jgi:hypothetical protein